VDQCELHAVRVEVEELAATGPVDSDPELLAGLVLREPPAQLIEEESLAKIPRSPVPAELARWRRAKICLDFEPVHDTALQLIA
jgi:hypothetical protein